MFGLFFGLGSVVCNILHSDGKKILKISHFLPCFKNSMINRENLIKIGRAGGNAPNRETPDQTGRAGISENEIPRHRFRHTFCKLRTHRLQLDIYIE